MVDQQFKDEPNKLKAAGPDLAAVDGGGFAAETEPDLKKTSDSFMSESAMSESESSEEAGLMPGQIIGEHFELIALIGKGGLGAVYSARHILLNTTVAIKFILPHLYDSKTLIRFQREAQACAKLKHPYIAGVYDFGVHEDRPYIVMEYVDGTPLNEIIDTSETLTPERTLRLLKQAADALAHAHSMKVVHRDVKPHNIMVCNTKDGETIKLIDFGLARMIETEAKNNLTKSGEVFGTPNYMSPEQCKGIAVDARTDIYSLGCVAYEMLSGKPPFTGDTPLQVLMRHITEPAEPLNLGFAQEFVGLTHVVDRALLKDPSHRYQTAQEMLNDLELIGKGRKPHMSFYHGAARLQRLARKRTRAALWSLSAALLVVALSLRLAPSLVQYQHKAAFDALTQKINEYPDSQQNQANYLTRAHIYSERGEYDSALSDLTDAARVGQLDSRGNSFKAVCLEQVGRFSDSADAASLASRMDANNAEAYRLLSLAESHLGKYDDAVRDATIAIVKSDLADYNYNSKFYSLVTRARAYNQLKRFADSLQDLSLAITLIPHSAPLSQADKNQIALCFTCNAEAEDGLNRLQDAQKDLSNAIQYNPANARSFLISADVEEKLNQNAKAKEDLEQARLLDPTIEQDALAKTVEKRLEAHR